VFNRLGIIGIALTSIGLLAALGWFLPLPAPREPGPQPGDLAAAPPKAGPDPFGYSVAFDLELKKIGQITPAEFATRYPPPKYLPGLSTMSTGTARLSSAGYPAA